MTVRRLLRVETPEVDEIHDLIDRLVSAQQCASCGGKIHPLMQCDHCTETSSSSEPTKQENEPMTVRRLTPEELARIKRKLVATSPGPWFYRRDTSIDDRDRGEIVGGVDQTVCAFGFDSPYSDAGQAPSKKDLDFICDAPEIVARLISEIEAQDSQLDVLQRDHDEAYALVNQLRSSQQCASCGGTICPPMQCGRCIENSAPVAGMPARPATETLRARVAELEAALHDRDNQQTGERANDS